MTRIRRALISVSDKTGIESFAKSLRELGVELVSTGGTAKQLRNAGLDVLDVSEVTGFPEILDGRVKTLHPTIHGGLLARQDNRQHQKALAENGISPIELVIVNLYPFEDVVAQDLDDDTVIENIDIGGPAMTRAAAKNHAFVTTVVDPEDYEPLVTELRENDCCATRETRMKLAAKAFARTASYDAAISSWFQRRSDQPFAGYFSLGGKLLQSLRYGENPHQHAAFYSSPESRHGVATAEQVQGKELSYNNINDTDAAFECVAEFDPSKQAACVIVKHANPCGVAVADTCEEAWQLALRCDPVSAFGGIIAFNKPIGPETATLVSQIFAEVIIAPGLTDAAADILAARKNLRVLVTGGLPDPATSGLSIKTVAGGILAQSRDDSVVDAGDLAVVTRRKPTEAQIEDLIFAFKVAKHVKSNAIVYARDGATVGIGAGQMSRLDSSRIAAQKARDAAAAAGLGETLATDCVVASDAFFPFADGLLQAAAAGASAVIQPGGSLRDDEIIAAADEKDIAMVFTGKRHFRH